MLPEPYHCLLEYAIRYAWTIIPFLALALDVLTNLTNHANRK